MAIEEALLADNGFLVSGFGTGTITTESEECLCEAQEATTSSQGPEYCAHNQVIILSETFLSTGNLRFVNDNLSLFVDDLFSGRKLALGGFIYLCYLFFLKLCSFFHSHRNDML